MSKPAQAHMPDAVSSSPKVPFFLGPVCQSSSRPPLLTLQSVRFSPALLCLIERVRRGAGISHVIINQSHCRSLD